MSHWDDNYGKDRLIGLRVSAIELSNDGSTLAVQGTKDDCQVDLKIVVDGDCCSHSWIESVVEKQSLIGHEILKWEDLELPNQPFNGLDCERCGEDHSERYAHDSLAFYGFAMFTEAGRCVIDFRNDSNGYYGGNLRVE